MPFHITILQRGLILVIVPFLIQATFAWLVADIHQRQTVAQEQSLKTKEVLLQARQALTLLLDEETAVRGYVITGDSTFNEPYEVASQQLPEVLRKIQLLVSNDPSQQAAVQAITAKSLTLFEWHTKTLSDMRDGATETAVAAVKGGQGKRQMDDLRKDLSTFIEQMEFAGQAREASLLVAQSRLREFVTANTILGFVAMISLALIFYRGISHRLDYVVENTRRMATNQPLLTPLEGRDEIAELDRAFHSMASNLLGARAAVEQKMNLLQSILDNMSEGVMMVDQHGQFLLHNPAAAEMLGVGAKDVAPDAWSRTYGLFLPDQVTPYPDRDLPLPRALRNETIQGEEIYVQSPASPAGRWISVTARPLRNAEGKVWGATAVFRDATQRKHAEEQLRSSANEIRDLYNHAPCGYHSVDNTGTFVAMNDTELRWLGYTRDEVLGKKRFPELITPQDRIQFEAAFPRFKQEGWIENLEFTMIRKDGSTFPVVLNASAIRDDQGNYVSSRSIVLDISERKEAEENIRRLNASLERRIEERTAELTEANRELHQKNKENEMFVYSVSHDLRSPLVNLQGFGQELGLSCADLRALLLGDEVPQGIRDRGVALLNGPMAKSLRYVHSGVLRLSTIIDGMLRLSRTGRVIYRWQKVDMNAVVARIVDALRGTAEQQGAVVNITPLEPAWGDPTALEQVFANLITNAINYLDPQRPGQIEIGCVTADSQMPDTQRTYYVRDNGLGIAEAYHPKVFQAFQRLHPEMATGEGIGLTIVQRIVERHRGRIWFESNTGAGCTFYVSLPTSMTYEDRALTN